VFNLAFNRSMQQNREAASDNDLNPICSAPQTENMPADRPRSALAISLIVSLGVIATVVTPFAGLPLLPIPGFMTAFTTSMIVINLILAALLFSRGIIAGQDSSVRLGTAFFFTAIILVPLLGTFPGALMQVPLIGGVETAIWLWYSWHIGFGLIMIRFAMTPDALSASVPRSITGCLLAVCVLTLVCTVGLPYLPALIVNNQIIAAGPGEPIMLGILVILIVALVLVATRLQNSAERLWLVVALLAAALEIWLTYCGSGRFTLGFYVAKGCSAMTSLIVLLVLLHDVTVLHHRMAAANDALTTLAQRDGLTGLANRRRLDEIAQTEWRRARRDAKPISVVMIDVDHFKNLNDHYGHMQGDDCLRLIAEALRSVMRRPGDLAARYGGEEFVLLLPATDVFGAIDVAHALHAKLRVLAFPHVASPFGVVTVSVGIATLQPPADYGYEKLLSQADANLYLAKKSGRNNTRADAADERDPSRV
jgi:diguanylate cyclase (GGDEF)-like protein